ncbi:hypothetical protein AB0N60_36745 [Streptomyces microflavus]
MADHEGAAAEVLALLRGLAPVVDVKVTVAVAEADEDFGTAARPIGQ